MPVRVIAKLILDQRHPFKWSAARNEVYEPRVLKEPLRMLKKKKKADKSRTVMNDSQGTSNHIWVEFTEIAQPDKNEEHEKDGVKIIGMFFFLTIFH